MFSKVLKLGISQQRINDLKVKILQHYVVDEIFLINKNVKLFS